MFARMSGLLLTTDTAGSALRAGTTLAQEIFPDTAGAGMSLLDEDGTQITTAATGEVVERADRLQYELRAGPCLTAWADRTVVRVDDLARDPRWPDWARRAARELGLRASLSVPVVAGDTALGRSRSTRRGRVPTGNGRSRCWPCSRRRPRCWWRTRSPTPMRAGSARGCGTAARAGRRQHRQGRPDEPRSRRRADRVPPAGRLGPGTAPFPSRRGGRPRAHHAAAAALT